MSVSPALTPTQRAAAIDRAAENIALRSGAGCGKTFVLAHRYAELLARSQADEPLSGLVALTFTDKAALEMAQRVRRMLAERLAGASAADQKRLRRWLEDLPEARISTIHSFCASVLRSHAIEAGIDPSFAVCADELVTARMRAEAADEAVLSAVERGADDVAELVAAEGFGNLAGLVRWLVEHRAAYDKAAYADADAILARWRARADRDLREAWQRLQGDTRVLDSQAALEGLSCGDPDDKLAARIAWMTATTRALLADHAAWSEEALSGFEGGVGNIGRKDAWGSTQAASRARELARKHQAVMAEYARSAGLVGQADARAARALAALVRLAAQAEERHARAKQSRGLVDFDDLLVHARDLTRDNAAVRRAIGAGIDQLLIDECQDTDGCQMDLLLALLGRGRDEAPPAGKVFVVGDAMQSIYRFRGAQVEVFRDLCSRLGPDKQESLDVSFRTHAAGVAFVNHLFGRMMGPDYVPIRAHRQEVPPQPAVEILLAAGAEPIGSADEAVAVQAAATAERIAEMIRGAEKLVWDAGAGCWRGVRPGDIAILFARMTRSLDYERQLQLRGVPYYVLKGTGFFQQQEVFDVLNALRVIDNPFDDVALLGVLRSGMFGLDDGALMHLAEQLRPPYLPALTEALDAARPVGGLSEGQGRVLAVACRLLDRLHRRKDAVGIDELIEEVLAAGGYEAALLSRREGRRRLGNVHMLIDRARSAAAGQLSLAGFIDEVHALTIDQSRSEQAAVGGEAEDVVRIMTIHKAKGLEFPVVFVPDLNAGQRTDHSSLLCRADWGLTYKARGEPDGGGKAPDPLSHRRAAECEADDERRERVRQLYVAATRHRDHLVFVGADRRGGPSRLCPPTCYLAQMDEALGIGDAVDAGSSAIPYGDGEYEAALRAIVPAPPAADRRDRPIGWTMLQSVESGEDLAQRLVEAAEPGELPLLGPLPPSVGRVELAVTALSDFEACPMLYRWRYELRTPTGPHGPDAPPAEHLPDPLTLGTLCHRCMELLDFAKPQPAEALVRRAVAEMDPGEAVDEAAVALLLEEMLKRFARHDLRAALAAATETRRELPFVMRAGPAVLHGQIDLLYRHPEGTWRVVDYKSDRVGPEGVEAHARRYELQMLLYAAAVGRHLGQCPDEATLYFLRDGRMAAIGITDQAAAAAVDRAAALAAALIEARRTGRFGRGPSQRCAGCAYGRLCGPG